MQEFVGYACDMGPLSEWHQNSQHEENNNKKNKCKILFSSLVIP
jgi:hypothetical protein